MTTTPTPSTVSATCRGSIVLGTACGKCSKCLKEIEDRLRVPDETEHNFITRMITLMQASSDPDISRLVEIILRYRKFDTEASNHVESVICMRTDFTGDPPYVGWEGLGLALREALDERDRLRDVVAELEAKP